MYDQLKYADNYASELEYFYDCYKPSLKQIYDMYITNCLKRDEFNELRALAKTKELEIEIQNFRKGRK